LFSTTVSNIASSVKGVDSRQTPHKTPPYPKPHIFLKPPMQEYLFKHLYKTELFNEERQKPGYTIITFLPGQYAFLGQGKQEEFIVYSREK
jgi:hypothetical protein